ncbi:MAG TPA: DUF447 domain-containing protein [Gemmataceae bacterium]|nr:DUF447 domain-containing protein [Gemmataceae bacterium]
MILEGIVTTVASSGAVNIAPMGPRVDASMQRFVLRPFRSSRTYANLKSHGEGVFHVTDDVLLLAQAAVGEPSPTPALIPASRVLGFILKHSCRCYEFRVVTLDDREERTHIEVEVIASARLRDFFGFNRAKHAVVEAAILATRTEFLPIDTILDEYRKLAVLVEKTGGAQEHEAFRFLRRHVEQVAQSRAQRIQS